MTIQLRPYQQKAVENALWARDLIGNDLLILATGAGKSLIIASLVNQLNEEVLILQPSKEVLMQNYSKLKQYVPESQIGVFSASLKRHDIRKFTFATIQSIYRKPELFQHIKLVIVDECDTIDPKKIKTMYGAFFKAINNPKVYGLTATPYRNYPSYKAIENGLVEAGSKLRLINRVFPKFWDRILCNIGNKELVAKGYLTPLDYEDVALIKQEQIRMNFSGSDFDLDNYAKKIQGKHETVTQRIRRAETEHKSVLVFCNSINEAMSLSSQINGSQVVYGEMKGDERDYVIDKFKAHQIKTVFNVNCLSVGFDHPSLDCIVNLRPTKSLRFWYQALGRGSRIAEGKTSCKLIDFSDTISNLGKIETIELKKINGKWELLTETGSFHDKQLYSCIFKKKGKKSAVDLDNTLF